MGFLIRSAFWLSVVVVLLPTPDSMKTPETKVGATEAVTAAAAAVSDMRGFCQRQPEACEVGSNALTAFGYKAQASAKWVYDFLTEKMSNDRTASGPAPVKQVPAVDMGPPSQNTLTPADTAPAWRAPQPTKQASAR